MREHVVALAQLRTGPIPSHCRSHGPDPREILRTQAHNQPDTQDSELSHPRRPTPGVLKVSLEMKPPVPRSPTSANC